MASIPSMGNEATIAGSSAAQTRQALAQYQEWHNETRDQADAGSVYTMLASMELTVATSLLDLGTL